ncbi:MAG: HRDC domain-containing protein, partial [Myxococcota bacterium]
MGAPRKDSGSPLLPLHRQARPIGFGFAELLVAVMSDSLLIDTPEELEALAQRLRNEPIIAVDTEADSFFHYVDKVCLLQFGTRDEVFLVDPLALPRETGLEAIAPILGNPRIRKVFHAAEYDLYVLQRSGGIKVRSIFDTMISAQLLGYGSVGLGALVEHHFQVQLSKDQQRTDWSRRPLRPAQLAYAASDVRYLIELSERLERELVEKKRLDWAREEFRTLDEREWPERGFDKEGYLRIKGATGLSGRGLAILRELYLMRDRRARKLDRPPFKVLGNGTLLDLAQKPPTSKRALSGRRGVSELVIRRLGPEILQAVEQGMTGPEHGPRERKSGATVRRRLDRRGEGALQRLKRWRAERASELSLDPGVFCPNATLEEIAAAAPKDRAEIEALKPVKRWWAKNFGAEVLATLQQPDAHADDRSAAKGKDPGDPTEKKAPKSRRSRRRRGKRA